MGNSHSWKRLCDSWITRWLVFFHKGNIKFSMWLYKIFEKTVDIKYFGFSGNVHDPTDRKLDDWASKTNINQGGYKRGQQDSKLDDWSSKTAVSIPQQGNVYHGKPGINIRNWEAEYLDTEWENLW